jgi:hypothetical protein
MLRLVENHSLPRTAAFFDLDKTVIAKSSTLTFSKSFYQGGLINRHAQAFGRVARTVDFGLYSSEFADRGSRTITGGRPLHARLPWLGSLPGQAPPARLLMAGYIDAARALVSELGLSAPAPRRSVRQPAAVSSLRSLGPGRRARPALRAVV